MRKIWTCLWVFFSFCTSARTVDSLTARAIANHFASVSFRDGRIRGVHNTESATHLTWSGDNTGAFHLFRFPEGGFVLVAGDDRARPILAWSDECAIAADSVPVPVYKWLSGYAHDLAWLKLQPEQGESRYVAQWMALKSGSLSALRKSTSVTPMLTTRWNQTKFYNSECPYDTAAKARALTGCVATVMAQIMHYWQWPAHGIGFHAYSDNAFGVLSANFGHTGYNWAVMPNTLSAENAAVAQIMYQAGVSVNMDYGVNSSSSYVLAANCPLRYNAQFSLTNFFCYKPGIRGLYRQDYNDNSWLTVIESELQSGRPVIYNGMNDSEGHSFIADGFDNNNLIHFNWGWGGYYNGYYSIDSIVPDTISFMKTNSLLAGIEPDRSRLLIMNSVITSQTAALYAYRPFSLSSGIINTGLSDYKGTVTVELKGDAYPFFSHSVRVADFKLGAGDSVSLNIDIDGLPPGQYHAQLWYGASGADSLIDSTAEYANNDLLQVYGDSVSQECTVFPNPARAYCYVSLNWSAATGYQMINTAGETVAAGNIGKGVPVLVLPVQYLADGLYWVVLATPTGIQRLKIVVVH